MSKINQPTNVDIANIAQMTHDNDHTGALIYIYEKLLKNKRAVKALKAVGTLHEYFNQMPKELMDIRYNHFFKPAILQLEKKYSAETVAKISVVL